MSKEKRKYTNPHFDYTIDYRDLDLRTHPELYSVGVGEQGVLMVQPYKSEICPHWRFKTPEIAQKSADKIYSMFLEYKKNDDFVGMDMARKFLQMGFTRSRRYANHKSGQKYESNPHYELDPAKEKEARKKVLPQEEDWADNEKAQSAKIFWDVCCKAKDDPEYIEKKKHHIGWQKEWRKNHPNPDLTNCKLKTDVTNSSTKKEEEEEEEVEAEEEVKPKAKRIKKEAIKVEEEERENLTKSKGGEGKVKEEGKTKLSLKKAIEKHSPNRM